MSSQRFPRAFSPWQRHSSRFIRYWGRKPSDPRQSKRMDKKFGSSKFNNTVQVDVVEGEFQERKLHLIGHLRIRTMPGRPTCVQYVTIFADLYEFISAPPSEMMHWNPHSFNCDNWVRSTNIIWACSSDNWVRSNNKYCYWQSRPDSRGKIRFSKCYRSIAATSERNELNHRNWLICRNLFSKPSTLQKLFQNRILFAFRTNRELLWTGLRLSE